MDNSPRMPLDPVEVRHWLHQNPELGYAEKRTTQFLLEQVQQLEGVKIHRPLETGMVVERTKGPGPYLLFRADIDALPIVEQTGWAYASTNGCMHACGHDVHASILYAFLRNVVQNDLPGNFLFFFQPAEEGGGGAEKAIQTGIFEGFNISHSFALHVTDEMPKGVLGVNDDVLFASAFLLVAHFEGVSAHVAAPQMGKDALNACRTFLDLADRLPNPPEEYVLYARGLLHAGDVHNIIPAKARIEGSLRSRTLESNLRYLDRLEQVARAVELATGVNVKLETFSRYPGVQIDPGVFRKVMDALSGQFRFERVPMKMTGEDFGFLCQKYPSMMFWLGTGTGNPVGLHNPRFLPDDDIIEFGAGFFQQLARAFQPEGRVVNV
ncbi:MAG TPA: M20 family metallopeptidase [Thermotogota bacterium]|nr:M20 family metallopeptidase [Thermotogota bacterium]